MLSLPPSLSPALLQQVMDQLPDTMFFVKDAAARYIMVNAVMVRRCGKRDRAEVLGLTAAELFPGAAGRYTTQTDLQVIARGEPVLGRLELYHVPGGLAAGPGGPDPARRWCLTHKYPLARPGGLLPGGAGGSPPDAGPGLVGISRDLPAQRSAEPSGRGAGRGTDGARQDRLYAQLERVTAHIAAQLEGGGPAGELRVPVLARVAGLSADQLERAARQVFGVTPKQLVMKARVEAASALLRGGALSVSDIAHRCGYADHSAFTRQFRAAVGLTPTQYREAQ